MVSQQQINRYQPDYITTPGEILEEYLDSIAMTKAELARRTGLTSKTINEIIKGRAPVTPETALKLERVFGRPARFWINLEALYQEDRVRLAEQESMEANLDWQAKFPVREMIKLGWLPDDKDKTKRFESLLRFFGVASPMQWEAIWISPNVAYRQSNKFKISREAVSAWLRRGELEAREISCQPFNPTLFQDTLSDIRKLTQERDPQVFVPSLTRKCAAAGVAVIFTPSLPQTRISGAARWVNGKPVIQLSLRHGSNDHIWFTFFHESVHITKHGKKLLFLDWEEALDGDCEEEANSFASNLLIPSAKLMQFVCLQNFSRAAVIEFARSIEIAPGIVVGRLQHDRHIPFNRLNDLKVTYSWEKSDCASSPSG